jgi:hypothetical protein
MTTRYNINAIAPDPGAEAVTPAVEETVIEEVSRECSSVD